MINSVHVRNLGSAKDFHWEQLAHINVLIGENGTGKTSILKMMYAVLQSLESYGKGNSPMTLEEELSNKIYWTFQVDKLGELVTKGEEGPLDFRLALDNKKTELSFGSATKTRITHVQTDFTERWGESTIFIPAKEVLSLFHVIKKSREIDRVFGFDDTYLDLVKALEIKPQKGKNYYAFAKGRANIGDLIGGYATYYEPDGQWYFRQGRSRLPINIASEGTKKLAIFNTLLTNRYLRNNSILFIDEPEASLHPKAVSVFMDMLHALSANGMQIFLSTHSYFVVKKLALIAKKAEGAVSIPIASMEKDGSSRYADLMDGLPDNAIIDESVRLYREELDFDFGA